MYLPWWVWLFSGEVAGFMGTAKSSILLFQLNKYGSNIEDFANLTL